jgi:hypothetical protein
VIGPKVTALIIAACAPYVHHNVTGHVTRVCNGPIEEHHTILNGTILGCSRLKETTVWDTGVDARKTCEEVYTDCVRHASAKKCLHGSFGSPPWAVSSVVNDVFDIENYAPSDVQKTYRRENHLPWRGNGHN